MALVKSDADGVILLIEPADGFVRVKVGEVADLSLSAVEAQVLAAELLDSAERAGF